MKKLIIVLCVLCFSVSAFAGKKPVLLIESYHAGYSWDASYKKGLEETLGQRYNIISFEMDTKRVPKTEYQKRADMAWDKYKQTKPAMVILGDDNALKYLGPKFVKAKAPTIYLGINNNPRLYLGNEYRKLTGILERPILKRTIFDLRQIMTKKADKVLVLFDSGTTSQVSLQHVFKDKDHITIGNIEVDLRLIGDWDTWKKTVTESKSNGYDVIVVGLYHTITDKGGNHISADNVMAWTSENTPVPPFGFWDFAVGKNKTIGGLVLYGKEQGLLAGKMALNILTKGLEPESITPITARNGRYLFSKSQLKKYNLVLPERISAKATFID